MQRWTGDDDEDDEDDDCENYDDDGDDVDYHTDGQNYDYNKGDDDEDYGNVNHFKKNKCFHLSLEEQRGLIGFLNSWNYGVTFEYIKYQFDYITY